MDTATRKDVSHWLGYAASLVGETSGPVCDTSTYLHHGMAAHSLLELLINWNQLLPGRRHSDQIQSRRKRKRASESLPTSALVVLLYQMNLSL
ncbi:hypothetical protein VPH35_106767 [Triticum aestivum]